MIDLVGFWFTRALDILLKRPPTFGEDLRPRRHITVRDNYCAMIIIILYYWWWANRWTERPCRISPVWSASPALCRCRGRSGRSGCTCGAVSPPRFGPRAVLPGTTWRASWPGPPPRISLDSWSTRHRFKRINTWRIIICYYTVAIFYFFFLCVHYL